jgi:hypothetical protein
MERPDKELERVRLEELRELIIFSKEKILQLGNKKPLSFEKLIMAESLKVTQYEEEAKRIEFSL